jgi:anti-sigma regulatory factor (Ser/Thr protein kinase)
VPLAGVTTLHATLADAPGELARAQQLLDEFAEANDLSADVLFALNVALDEIAGNIVKFAYADRAGGEIRLRLSGRWQR